MRNIGQRIQRYLHLLGMPTVGDSQKVNNMDFGAGSYLEEVETSYLCWHDTMNIT